jgi:mono/diheme cytochrome c family protein
VAYLYAVQYFADPADPRRGEGLVASKGCLTCHTLSGLGGKVAGDLARVKGLDSSPAVIAALWNHAFLMEQWPERQKVAWPRFRAEEMAELAAFLRTTGRTR